MTVASDELFPTSVRAFPSTVLPFVSAARTLSITTVALGGRQSTTSSLSRITSSLSSTVVRSFVDISLPIPSPSDNGTRPNQTARSQPPPLIATPSLPLLSVASELGAGIASLLSQIPPRPSSLSSNTSRSLLGLHMNHTSTTSISFTSKKNSTSNAVSISTSSPSTTTFRHVITTSPASTQTQTFTFVAPKPTLTTSESQKETRDLSRAQLAGTIASCIVGLCLALACLFYLWRRRKQRLQRAELEVENKGQFHVVETSGNKRRGRRYPESAWLYDPPIPPVSPVVPISPLVSPRAEASLARLPKIHATMLAGVRQERDGGDEDYEDLRMAARLSRVFDESNPYARELDGYGVTRVLRSGGSQRGRAGREEVMGFMWEDVRRPKSGVIELEDTQVGIEPGRAM